jgi:hypothetical protein
MRSTIGWAAAFAVVLLLILANATFSWTIAAVMVWLIAMAAAAVLILRRPGTLPGNRKHGYHPYGEGTNKKLSGAASRRNRMIQLKGRPVPKNGDS